MSALAFLDTETTGLDPDRHQIWDVAMILDGEEYEWQLPVDLARADTIALNIGRFHERRRERSGTEHYMPRPFGSDPDGEFVLHPARLADWCAAFAKLTWGVHLVGAVISFDEERLRRLLRANGSCPGWHYHIVDVEALAAGQLGLAPPWKSDELSTKVGVDPEQFDRHTALGDARWAKAIYEAVVS